MFYTYIHYKASDNRPFYIGKGRGKRAYVRTQRNKSWQKIAERHGLKVEIAARWSTEQEAFDHERLLIACHRELGYELCNMTDGGEGSSGAVLPPRSAEHSKKISLALKGRSVSDEQRVKLSVSASKRRHNELTKSRIRDAAKAHALLPKIREARRTKQLGALNHGAKAVLCLDTGQVFGSIREAARYHSTDGRTENSLRVSIALCCSGSQETTLGYRWSFVIKGGEHI